MAALLRWLWLTIQRVTLRGSKRKAVPRQDGLGIIDYMQRRITFSFCARAEVAVDGLLPLASTKVFSVEKDCSSRLFVLVVDVDADV